MILAFIGIIVLLIGVVVDGGPNWIMIVGGAILAVFGLCAMSVSVEETKARSNRRRYWAYGERPDWDRERWRGR